MITGAGLDAYYRLRTERAPKAKDPRREEWVAYDRDAVQRGCVTKLPDGSREIALLIDDLRCAACGWLVEQTLQRIDGVREVRLNAATARLLLRWDPRRTALSSVLGELAALGYAPHPLGASAQDAALTRERRTLLKRLWVAGLAMMQVMMYAIAVYVGDGQDLDPGLRGMFHWVSLLITSPVVFYSAAPFFEGAWRGLKHGAPGMDLPVALAIALAFSASVWITIQGGSGVYFDSVAMFTFFLLTGRWFELNARHSAVRTGDALARLVPDTAEKIVRGSGAPTTFVGAVELQPGDIVRVRAGDRFPCDGNITEGDTQVDESLLTGESRPLARHSGDAVIAGSVNVDAPVLVRVRQAGSGTVVAGITRLLARAQADRPRVAKLADRVARWFVLVMLGVAAAVFMTWLQLDPARAFPIALAVLVVACPCALALATPVALTAGTLAMARHGLLVTRADALEALAHADMMVFDKTGTLTRGALRIAAVTRHADLDEHEATAIAAALERASEHPIARAFRDHDDGRIVIAAAIERHRGVSGTVAGQRYTLRGSEQRGSEQRGSDPMVANLQRGSDPMVANSGVHSGGIRGHRAAPTEGGAAPTTDITLADDYGPIATFHLADTLRANTAESLQALRDRGLELEILSGDDATTVAAVAKAVGVERWAARQSPEQKLARVQQLQRGSEQRGSEQRGSDPMVANSGVYSGGIRGHRAAPTVAEDTQVAAAIRGHRAAPTEGRAAPTEGRAAPTVAMNRVVAAVGDGINDAPVLAAADVAIAVRSGSALAQTSASMVLLGDTLAPLVAGVDLSRRTLRTIRQNLGLSLCYNLGAIPLAAIGWIPPWAAAIGMAGSSLVVVINASRLQRGSDQRGSDPRGSDPMVANSTGVHTAIRGHRAAPTVAEDTQAAAAVRGHRAAPTEGGAAPTEGGAAPTEGGAAPTESGSVR